MPRRRTLHAFAIEVSDDGKLARVDAINAEEAISWFRSCHPAGECRSCRKATKDDVFQYQISEGHTLAQLPLKLVG